MSKNQNREVNLELAEQLQLAAIRFEAAAREARSAAEECQKGVLTASGINSLNATSSHAVRGLDLVLDIKRRRREYPPTSRVGAAPSVGQLIAHLQRFNASERVLIRLDPEQCFQVEVLSVDGYVALVKCPTPKV
jgi:hypothetical protein